MNAAARHILIRLDRDESGYPPFEAEELDVTRVDEGLWRVGQAPAFAYGFAAGDVLSGEVDPNGDLWATGVVSSAGNWCARVIPVEGADQAPIAAEFRTLGCGARETEYGMIVVEPPRGLDPALVLGLLRRGSDESRWHFDLGVVPDGLVP
jgi:hypothetical protein